MSNKRDKKKNTSKKVAKNETINTLKLDNGAEIPAMTIFIKDSKHFNVNDIDINKIRVSNVKLFMKENNLYKYYIFYEDGDKYIPLNIHFSKVLAGYYNEYLDEDGKYGGNVSKTMNFVIGDDIDLLDKIVNIFKYIGEKLEINLLHRYSSESGADIYLKTKVYKRTHFNKKGCGETHIIPNKKTKYECKPLLQIQSIYYVQDDKKDTVYHPQMRLEQCGYKDFIESNIAQKDFMFTDSEPESEEEFNDDNDDRDE